jgi:Na+-driven multidrug efflux pump
MLDIPGVIRGCGLQKIGACVNLGAYYLVGVPAALCFAFFYHFGGMVLNSPPLPHETVLVSLIVLIPRNI